MTKIYVWRRLSGVSDAWVGSILLVLLGSGLAHSHKAKESENSHVTQEFIRRASRTQYEVFLDRVSIHEML